MSQEQAKLEDDMASQSSQDYSQDSQQFEELVKPENESVNSIRSPTLNKTAIISKPIISVDSMQNQIQILKSKIEKLEQQVLSHEEHEQNLRGQKNKYAILYQNSTKQCQNLKQKNSIFLQENRELRETNVELKECIMNLKQQKQQYVEKINCLQSRLQLQRQQFDSKISIMRKNAQAITKIPLKNVDNDSFVKTMASKLVQIERLINKMNDIDAMIIDKSPKPKNNPQSIDVLQQKYQFLEKVESLLLKQSQRIIALRQHTNSLQQQIQQHKKGNNTMSLGLGKLFNPVMKLCKPEEDKISQIKRNKDNK